MRVGLAALLVLSLAAPACRRSDETTLHAVVSWNGLTIDQLEFAVAPAGEQTRAAVLRPTLRPEQARGMLTSPQDVIIRLRDDEDGVQVACRVSALFRGELQQVVAAAPVTVRRHQTVICALELPAGAAALHLSNGAACLDARQCASGNCVDGLCCDSPCDGSCMACNVSSSPGVCSFVPDGAKPSDAAQCPATDAVTCGDDGTCDGHGACRKHPAGTACAAGRCDGSTVSGGKICDGAGRCAPAPILSCAPFLCDAAAAAARCLETCTSDADCVAGRPCVAGSCGPRPDGGACATDAQCQSGHCADGVCCDGACDGPCVACNLPGFGGMCRPVTAGAADPHARCTASRAVDPSSCGQSGTCDGNGGCALYAAETICVAPMCSGTTVMKAGTCDGAGVCQPGGTLRCNPYGCKDGRCNASCGGDADCAPGQACDTAAASCGPKGLGQTCGGAAECGSGFCVDGVCCNEACAGACRSCALASSMGVCKNAPGGAADPRGTCRATPVTSCGADGLCDGNGGCRSYPAGTMCAPETCTGSTHTLAGRCDAAAACATGGTLPCAPYRCNGTACFSSCGSDADCLPPNVCLGGACGLKPGGAPCALDAECATAHCTDGVCCEADNCGTCRSCSLGGSPGRCAAVAAGVPEPHGACLDRGAASCGSDGTCDGAAACRLYPAGTTCVAASCTSATLTQPSTCNGAGVCVAGGQLPCVPYVCGTGACKTMCTSSSDCVAPAVCMGGSCGLKPLGASCGGGGECASGQCTDGVCCSSGSCPSCQACNVSGRPGSCQPVPAGADDPRGACAAEAVATCGRDGRCDGAGACRRYAAGTSCGSGSCAGNSVVGGPACDGAGHCVAATGSTDCAPYVCRSGACATACGTDADCAPPAACAGSICRRNALGAGCTTGSECDTGNCVDGVCCAAASCGACQSCNVPGFLGSCAALAAGAADPHARCTAAPAASCGLDGACNGAGACRSWIAGTVCAAATCSAKKMSQNPKTCDGNGTCANRGTVVCAPDDCDTATGRCP